MSGLGGYYYTPLPDRPYTRIVTVIPGVSTDLIRVELELFSITTGKHYEPVSYVWGDPNEFRPERYLDSKDTASLLRDSWVPFATGPRQCPARNFALYEQRALAVMLLREYEWTLPKGSIHKDGLKNAFSPFALTLPYDLDITFTKQTT